MKNKISSPHNIGFGNELYVKWKEAQKIAQWLWMWKCRSGPQYSPVPETCDLLVHQLPTLSVYSSTNWIKLAKPAMIVMFSECVPNEWESPKNTAPFVFHFQGFTFRLLKIQCSCSNLFFNWFLFLKITITFLRFLHGIKAWSVTLKKTQAESILEQSIENTCTEKEWSHRRLEKATERNAWGKLMHIGFLSESQKETHTRKTNTLVGLY
jgi:hypothetical protein